MSGVAAPGLPEPVPPFEPEPLPHAEMEDVERRPLDVPAKRSRESWVLFGILFVIYAAIGLRVVVGQHVVVFDSMSHLAHAYFSIYNDPPKLAAIGFEWPPLMTLVFLPLAAIKPLATSLAAIPLVSALFGAALVTVINRTLTLLELPSWMRWSLVALFAANPMVVFYATNGMAEAVYLTFLALGLHNLVAWRVTGESHKLALSGIAFALAVLTRYEMIAFAAVAGVGMIALLAHRRASRDEVEGDTVLFAAPIVYGVGAWFFFNWLIVGDPFFWIKRQAEKNITVGRGDVSKEDLPSIPLHDIAGKVIDLNAQLFPLLLLVVPLLLFAAFRRRDPMSLVLAALASLNALMTGFLIMRSHDLSLLQLRYNMRAFPVAMIAVGWLCWVFREQIKVRFAIWAVAALTLLVTIPVLWSTMKTYPYQFNESAFVAAIDTGEDQAGTKSVGGYDVGMNDAQEMADFIATTTDDDSSIFTDDESVTQEVMLLGGRPDLFFDRIDRGDEEWRPVLADPWGHTEYILLSTGNFAPDQIQDCYPSALKGQMPGTEVLHRNDDFVFLKVDPVKPPNAPTEYPSDCSLSP